MHAKQTPQGKAARVRFAPSPTGLTHMGSARTALYNKLLAEQSGGAFILRIEDTDQKRFVEAAEADLTSSLKWLGLEWDEGLDVGGPHAPYHQSKRMEIYRQHAEELIGKGKAFYCFCSPEELAEARQQQQAAGQQPHYPGTCRDLDGEAAAQRVADSESHVVRFKTPTEGSITVHDRLRGDITVENRTIDDKILVKSDGHALYHLAAMVDDHLMGVTHVLRGEEWLASLPLHAHIYEAFGWEQPEWVHLSVFLKPSGKGKMSKRETAEMKLTGQSIFINDLKDLGYLPEAVVNWIALMGWSYDDKTEFFTMEDLVEKFSLDKLNPSPAAIDFKKLDHFNGLHIRAVSDKELTKRLLPYFEQAGIQADANLVAKITPIIQTRITTLDDAPEIAAFFFRDEIEVADEDLIGNQMSTPESAAALQRAHEILEVLPKFDAASMEEPMRAVADELGLKAGQLFGMLRNVVTGQRVSPPLFESMEIVGKDVVMYRIAEAIRRLDALGS